ncbi:MAG: TackOD1 domain-containing metal-binding protein [Thermoproteota archaeon]
MEMIEETPVSSLLNRSDVQALLRAFMDGSIKVLKPEPSPTGDITYPEAEKIMGASSKIVREILEKLAEEEILSEDPSTVMAICPYCGDNRFTVELACPRCESTRLKMGAAIEHLECGYIGFEEDFRNMVCPKCGKRMRALGIDYRKPGILYRCLSCKEFTGEPRKRYTCLKDRHVFYEDEVVSREVYSFRFNAEKKSFIEKWIMDLKPVVETLNSKGWRVQHPARIRGRSGVEHTFTLAASPNGSGLNTSTLVDVLVNDRPIDESALSLIFKALDVNAGIRIMIFVPELTEKAKTLFDYYRVLPNMLVFECESIDKVNEVILRAMNDCIKVVPKAD